jgi:hypothetical protein
MYLQTGSKIFNLLGGPAAVKKAMNMIRKNTGSNVKVISKPTAAQQKAATELSPEDLAAGKLYMKKSRQRRQQKLKEMRERTPEAEAEIQQRFKDIQSGKAAGFICRRKNKGGQVGNKKSSNNHANGNKFVASLYD